MKQLPRFSVLLAILLLAAGVTPFVLRSPAAAAAGPGAGVTAPCVAGEKTWDGEGATNNWSEAANWTCDAVPSGSDIVKFDATSTKDASIDINTSADDLRLGVGYTGIVSTAPGVAFSFGRNTASFFTSNQAAGSFVCGSGSSVTFFKTTFTMTGGSFDCRNGSVTLNVGSVNINGGTFDAPTGTMTLQGFSSGVGSALNLNSGGAFNHNGGTIATSADGGSMTGLTQPLVVNNLVFNGQTSQSLADSAVRVLGNMTLNPGGQLTGAIPTNWELHGNLTVANGAPTGSRDNTLITFAGSGDQNFLNSGGLNPRATWRVNKPAGRLILQSDLIDFGGLDLVSGIVNAGGFTVDVGGSTATGGSAGSYVIGKLRRSRLGAGVSHQFPVGSPNGYAPATAVFSGLTITVEAKDGVHPAMNPATSLARYWTVSQTGNANADMTFTYQNGDVNGDENLYAAARINNGTAFLAPVAPATNLITVTGETLFGDFTAGATLAPCVAGQKTWDGEGATGSWSESANWSCNAVPATGDKVLFNGASSKNSTIDVNAVVNTLEIDGYTGTVTNASSILTVESTNNVGMFRQTSGTFNGGSGTINLTLCCTAATTGFRLQGGTFVSTSGTLNLDSFSGSVIDSGATFQHNGGTVNIVGTRSGSFFLGGTATSVAFNNLNIQTTANLQGGLAAFARTLTANGALTINGRTDLGSVAMRALGNVTVGANSGPGASNLVFAGGANQTFANLGGTFPFQQLTVDKTSGTVTTNSPLPLRATADDLNITNGTLYAASGANVTARTVNIGPNGRFVNDSAFTLTIGTSVVNDGVVDFQGGGAACNETPGVDPITIASSNTTQKPWTGTGVNRLVDVSVTRMGGAGTKTVYSGTNVTGNGASWIFDSNCPPALAISPPSATLLTGQTQTFVAGGGFAPYVFSIAVNNSGATINPSTGVFTAGPTVNVTDTVRVTDVFGQTADASVGVFGVPTQLVFTVPPTNAVAGQTISPAVQVALRDAQGAPVLISGVQIQLAVDGSAATLNGTTSRSTVNGVAVFDDVNITRSGTYRLAATSGSLSPAQSSFFSVSPGAAAGLAILIQPVNAINNAPNLSGVGIGVVDALGNGVGISQVPVTVAIASNPASGALTGTLTRTTSATGFALFNDLRIDNAGVGYTLVLTAPGLSPATTNPFDILPLEVTNTNDSGAGSLRAAIIAANGLSGRQRVTFNIPGSGPHKIAPTSPLPDVLEGAVFDATSQPGYAGTPLVELSGEAAPGAVGLRVSAGNVTISGFAINGFGTGVSSIGSDFRLTNNFVGIDPSGTLARPNTNGGLSFSGTNSTIADNVISGNGGAGISFVLPFGATAHESSIVRNKIGTRPDGATPLPNAGAGVSILQSDNRTASLPIFLNIGGAEADGNVIAFNAPAGGAGIVHRAPLVSARIRRNRIFDNGATFRKLGIQFSFTNESTPNDPRDPDLGANARQNFPVITRVVSINGQTVIEGTLNSRPNTTHGIDFFARPVCDAFTARRSDGRVYVDSTSAPVVTNANGLASFRITTTRPVQIGDRITATAWAEDGRQATSEYMPCSADSGGAEVTGPRFAIGGQIVDQNGAPLPFVRVFVAGSGISTVTDSAGRYNFPNMPSGFNYTIGFTAPSYAPQPATRDVVNLQNDALNENFAAIRLGNISGQVLSRSNGATFPLRDATITVDGVGTTTTDFNGRYRFNSLPAATYSVTAGKTNFVFTPATVSATVNGDRTVDFVGELFSVESLSGRVMTAAPTLPVMNADGSAAMSLFPYSGGAAPDDGQLSPNGARIVFTQRSGGSQFFTTHKLRVANFDGSGIVDISEPTNNELVTELDPTWSDDLAKIAYIRGTISGSALTVVNADGSGRVPLPATSSLTPREADFSPDGTKIVFSAQRSNAIGIYVINTDGSGLTRLTSGTFDTFPRFSPDGSKILFVRLAGSFASTAGRLFTMSATGANPTEIATPLVNQTETATWSPDGAVIMFKEQSVYKAVLADGAATVTVGPAAYHGAITWSPAPSAPFAPGADVTASVGPVSVTFGGVGAASVATVTPIPPNSAGALPPGFAIANQAGNLAAAYEITATPAGSVTPPVTVCFTVSSSLTPTAFDAYRVLHNESGVLVDRTVSRDFATKRICAQTTSLSPFVIAELIDAGLPSIAGLVVDQNGAPMAGVSVGLTGSEDLDAITDSDGRFAFVNLTPNGDYSVVPRQTGVIFADTSRDFVGIGGENTVVFTGTAQTYSISGRVTDAAGAPIAGASVVVEGADLGSTVTDANGEYVFGGLPADGFFELTASRVGTTFAGKQVVDPLVGDATGVDFTAFTPTAGEASIGGRVATASGRAIRGVVVEISGGDLAAPRTATTGTFGFFRFDGLEAGQTYVVTVRAKRYRFENPAQVVNVVDNVSDADFTAVGN